MEGGETEEKSAWGNRLLGCAGGGARGGMAIGRIPVSAEKGDYFGFGEVEAEGFEGDFEFVIVNALIFVEVEEGEL